MTAPDGIDGIDRIRAELYPWHDGIPREDDPTYGQIDRDLQWAADDQAPRSLGQRVAIESTLQERRDRERGPRPRYVEEPAIAGTFGPNVGGVLLPDDLFELDPPRCQGCGCSELDACRDDGTGRPCHWIEPGWCSACQHKAGGPTTLAEDARALAIAGLVLAAELIAIAALARWARLRRRRP